MNKINLIIILIVLLICAGIIVWQQQKQQEILTKVEERMILIETQLEKVEKKLSYVSGDAAENVIDILGPKLDEIENRLRH